MRRQGPDAKGAAKASGDVHQPDLDERARRTLDGRPVAVDADEPVDQPPSARDQDDEARPGKDVNQAGYLKDKDAPGLGGGSKSR